MQVRPISEFKSYRQFLEYRIELEKKLNPLFTLRSFAQQLGLSASGLSMVLAGKRNLTLAAGLKLAAILAWCEADLSYFELLLRYEDSSEPSEKSYYQERLSRSSVQSSHVHVNFPSASLLEKWFYPAILIFLLDIANARTLSLSDAAQLLPAHFPLTLSEANQLVGHLHELGLLNLDANNHLHLHVGRLTQSLGERNYVKSVLAEATSRSVEKYHDKTHYFTTAALSLPKGSTGRIVALFKKWVEEISAAEGTSPDDLEVFQSAFAFFPIRPA